MKDDVITSLYLTEYMLCGSRFCYRNRLANNFPYRPLETNEVSPFLTEEGKRGGDCGAWSQHCYPCPSPQKFSKCRPVLCTPLPSELIAMRCGLICKTEAYSAVVFAVVLLHGCQIQPEGYQLQGRSGSLERWGLFSNLSCPNSVGPGEGKWLRCPGLHAVASCEHVWGYQETSTEYRTVSPNSRSSAASRESAKEGWEWAALLVGFCRRQTA